MVHRRNASSVVVSFAFASSVLACNPGRPRASSAAPSAATLAASGATRGPTEARSTVPGTGVSLVVPEGVRLGPVGATLADGAWELLVNVETTRLVEDPQLLALAESQWREREGGRVERVRFGRHEGLLATHLRARDGREADAYAVRIVEGAIVLDVSFSLRRDDPAGFARLKENALSVRWDPARLSPEASFRMSPGPLEGLVLEDADTGTLLYRPAPQERASNRGVTLVFLGGPLPEPFDASRCEAALRARAEHLAGEGCVFEPKRLPSPLVGCETELATTKGRHVYLAAIAIVELGGLVLVMGSAPDATFSRWAPVFRQAARRLAPMR
jgi:hypothetical protein